MDPPVRNYQRGDPLPGDSGVVTSAARAMEAASGSTEVGELTREEAKQSRDRVRDQLLSCNLECVTSLNYLVAHYKMHLLRTS